MSSIYSTGQQWNRSDESHGRRYRPLPDGRREEGKDSRWLTLEVCLDHLNGSCQKKEEECTMAHVPHGGSTLSSSAEFSQDRRVMCCYDFIKGKCYRKDPPCKFFHPPPHLREVLLHNGRQNLLLKSQRSHQAYNGYPFVSPAVLPMVYNPAMVNPMLTSKMCDATQIQFLSNHCVVNQGGMAYFYPFVVGADGWLTIPTNGIHGCQVMPSTALQGSLKQLDQPVLPMNGFDDSSPWMQNPGYSLPHAAICGPLCYGYGQGFMKRPPTFDVNKVQ